MNAKSLNNSILFFGKKSDKYCDKALSFLNMNFSNVISYLGDWGDAFPKGTIDWEGDYIISYLSRWVIPDQILKKAKKAAINFHPASPDFPGIGCNNFALYQNAGEYGVTCHQMNPKVDTGQIIAVNRFPVYQTDCVASLLERTYDYLITLFYEIIAIILRGETLPASTEKWSRIPYTRKEFNELGVITVDMSTEEIEKRIRAISYLNYKPIVEINGYVFELKTK